MKQNRSRIFLLSVFSALVLFSFSSTQGSAGQAHLWQQIESGQAQVMLRHALAPGFGDPGNFQIGDCTTQRNLDAEGRKQAKRIGDLFRANGIDKAAVYSSAWCRCQDTARLMRLGPVTTLEPLNSFFRNMQHSQTQTQALVKWLKTNQGDGPIVLVTHQVNITALTGVFPSSGEMVVFKHHRNGKIDVIGTIETR